MFLSELRDLDTSRVRSGSDFAQAEIGNVVDRKKQVVVLMKARPSINKGCGWANSHWRLFPLMEK